MKKENIAAADLHNVSYAAPQATVVEIAPSGILCQSQPKHSNESYGTGDTKNWISF